MKKFYNCFRDNYFYFFAYAVLGWIYELFYFIIVDDKIINRGFLHGPYLPIYGFGALVLLLLLKDIRHKKIKLANINISPVIMFIIIFIVTTIVEYIGHFILDKGFNIILWDYSNDFKY